MGLRFAGRSRDPARWTLRLIRVPHTKEEGFLSTTGRDDSAGSITWLRSVSYSVELRKREPLNSR